MIVNRGGPLTSLLEVAPTSAMDGPAAFWTGPVPP
jgi:hypothetical protein